MRLRFNFNNETIIPMISSIVEGYNYDNSISNPAHMKKNLITVLLFFLFISVSFSQGIYSNENLERASSEELDLYFKKAQKLKKTGGILLISAPITGIIGVLLWSDAWSGGSEAELTLGTGFIFASLGATFVGIPVRLTGSSRVKRVSKIWNTKYNTALMDLVPCSIYNYQTQNIQPGIKVRIRF